MMIDWDAIVHGANIFALAGGAWSAARVIIPAGLSIRDGLRDTAAEIRSLSEARQDHEYRIRELEKRQQQH